ncbi:hypothetical protein PENTCL1PPCAC_25119, partial [Pristionchus entomophagus]
NMLVRLFLALVPIAYVLCRSDSSLHSSEGSSEEELINMIAGWDNLTITPDNSTWPLDNSTEINRTTRMRSVNSSTTEGSWWWNITDFKDDNSTWSFDNSTSFSPRLWSLLPSIIPVFTLYAAP